MSAPTPEVAVLIARVRDDVARLRAGLMTRLPVDARVGSSIRVDSDYFVAAGDADGAAGALDSPVVSVADAAVVADIPANDRKPVLHAAAHAAVYRTGAAACEVVTVECGPSRAESVVGRIRALGTGAGPAPAWIAPDHGAPADPVSAITACAGRLVQARVTILAITGFGLAVIATQPGAVVEVAATVLDHLAIAKPV